MQALQSAFAVLALALLRSMPMAASISFTLLPTPTPAVAPFDGCGAEDPLCPKAPNNYCWGWPALALGSLSYVSLTVVVRYFCVPL